VGSRFSEADTRKSFLDPDSGVAVFSEAVTRKFFLGPDSGNSNILLLQLESHVQINVRVEICRIARRPMCAYMCM
jgi:hypothetical protein